VLDDEVKAILRELLAATGGVAATIVPVDDAPAAPEPDTVRVVPLGAGSALRLELGRPPVARDPVDLERARTVDHAVRALRAAARRWDTPLPALSVGAVTAGGTAHERAMARIATLLGGLAALQHGRNACVVLDRRLLAWAGAPEPLDEARWPLLERRARAAAPPGASSHGEVCDDDAYAVTFWYGAALLVYFAGPYGVDFVRHRARLVTRELAELLPTLDPGPIAPAARLPVP
jgi:hypothetical protein